MIHPSSVVLTNDIGSNVSIGPFCYIGPDVMIEDDCKIYNHVSIGNPAEHRRPKKSHVKGKIFIGRGVEIREFVTINMPTLVGFTAVGAYSLLMTKCHIGHDAVVGTFNDIGVGTTIGGAVRTGEYCFVGVNVMTHQFSKIGAYCMIGANAFFKGYSPEAITWAGVPARPIKVNTIGLDRIGLNKEYRQKLEDNAKLFIKKNTK